MVTQNRKTWFEGVTSEVALWYMVRLRLAPGKPDNRGLTETAD